MGLYFSDTAQHCRLLFSRDIVTWLFNSGGWFKTSIGHLTDDFLKIFYRPPQ